MIQEHKRFIEEAFAYSTYSQCLKKKVGAVLVSYDKGVIGTGYGGFIEPCEVCVRKSLDWQQDGCWSIHSELRAIFSAIEKYPTEFKYLFDNSIMYTTHGPCDQCIKYMVYFGIKICIFSIDYHNDYTKWNGHIEIYKFIDDDLILKNEKIF